MPTHNCNKEGEVARVTESLKVAHHRIDNLEKQSDLLMELVATVRVIAEQMTSINEKVSSNTGWIDENRQTLKELKEAPLKANEAYKRAFFIAVITSVVTTIAGLLAGRLL